MIVLAVTLRSQADKIEETARLLADFPKQANQEPGCLQYELFRDRKDPQTFFIFEKWESQEALNQHDTQAYLKEFRARNRELMEGPYQVLHLTP